MSTNLTVTVDGTAVPLDACGWLERMSCGCITAAVVAVVTGEGGWTLATADQAHRHFEPRKDRRERDVKRGFIYELITMDSYRERYRFEWECAEHKRKGDDS